MQKKSNQFENMSQNSELRENEQPCTVIVRKAYLLNEQLQSVLPLKHPIIQLQKIETKNTRYTTCTSWSGLFAIHSRISDSDHNLKCKYPNISVYSIDLDSIINLLLNLTLDTACETW